MTTQNPDLYQLRIYGFSPASRAPLIYHAPTMAECVDLAETRLYTCCKPGTTYTCEIWSCVGAVPTRINFTRTFVVKP